MKGSRRGFTLIELLAVMAIITVLGALLFPVFKNAKRSARVEGSKQYLKQQFIALDLYAQNSDGVFPPWNTVNADRTLHAPCSELDDWRTPCWSRQSPIVGSFGYFAALDQDDVESVSSSQVYPLLADVFSAQYRLGEFSGAHFPDLRECSRKYTCEFPDKIWFAYTDGSLRVQRNVMPPTSFTEGVRELFTWPSAFNRQIKRDRQNGSG